jgi:hypothetical protein
MPSAIQPEAPLKELLVLPHPSLIVDADELETMRAKRNDPIGRELYECMIADVEQYMAPSAYSYLDYEAREKTLWHSREGIFKLPIAIESLSFVYALTGERRYAEFARDVVFTIIRHRLGDGGSGRTGDTGGAQSDEYPGWRRNPGHDFGKYSYSQSVFYDFCCDVLTQEEREEFVAHAEECLQIAIEMSPQITRHNHNNRGSRCAIGNGMLALAVHGEADQDLVTTMLYRMLSAEEAYAYFGFGMNGAAFEGVMYGTSAAWLIPSGRALARRGLRDFSQHWSIPSKADFYLYNLLPTHDGFVPVGDSFVRLPGLTALEVCAVTGDPVARWMWEEVKNSQGDYVRDWQPWKYISHNEYYFYDPAVKPMHPAMAGYPLAKHFQDRGVISTLSGWGKDDALVTFFSGRQQWACHRQEDQNTFTLCALGERFAWDGGYGDNDYPMDGVQTRATEGHCGILIDGQGQFGFDQERWPRGHIVDFWNGVEWTYALGDARRAYGIDGSIQRVDRHLFFRRGQFPYLVVVDDLAVGDGVEHVFEWLLVTAGENRIELAQNDGGLLIHGLNNTMKVTVARTGEFGLSQDSFGPLPRARISQQGTTARFAVLLLPMAEGINSSAFEATMEGDVARARVSINGESEHIKFDLSDRNGPRAGDERVEVRFSVGE